MKYITAIFAVIVFQACSGPIVHYDYASTALNGADISYQRYAVAEPINPYTQNSPIRVSTAPRESNLKHTTPNSIQASNTFVFKKNPTTKLNDFALIIGITDYSSAAKVPYANNSAKAFKTLTEKTFGLPPQNIISLLDSKATSGSIKSKLYLLKELADPDSTIYFYFAGHGLPSKDGDTFLLPTDMSADAIEYESNLKLSNIYKILSSSDAKKVIVVMDSCFSGKDDSGKLLYHGVAPVLKVKKAKPTKKMTLFTAGGAKDFANSLDANQQRLFTFHFIKAVNSGLTKVTDIYNFTRTKVKRASLRKGIGYKQIPQIDGELNRKLY